MAAKKTNWMGTALGIGAALVVAYLVYRWFASSTTAQAVGAGYMPLTGGGASGSGGLAGYPNNNGLANPNAMGNPLGSILGKLGSMFGGSATPLASGSVPGAQTLTQLQNEISAIGGFNTNAINLPNLVDLGGQSLATYSPSYTSSLGGALTIPYQDTNGQLNLTAWGGNPIDLTGIGGSSYQAADNGSGGYATTMTDPTALDFGSISGG